MWFVIYGKAIDDRKSDVRIAGVFFGGAANTKEEAEKIARECVNSTRGSTAIPRLYNINNDGELIKTMDDAIVWFKRKEDQMLSNAEVLSRATKNW